MTLPAFGFVTVHGEPIADAPVAEDEWCARSAATGRAAAHLWQGAPGLTVPRHCTTAPGWIEASRRHTVHVRASGGGVVPQGPGVLALSLIWRADAGAPTASDAVYAELCARLAAGLLRLGIVATPQAVAGSFCDGRFNLAVDGRKIAGSAQSWRRIGGHMIVLAHAVIIATADPHALTDAANAFERDLGRGRYYRADALTSVAHAWQARHGQRAPADLEAQLAAAIAESFARVVVPAEADAARLTR